MQEASVERQVAGFTLVEVMVALVIVTFGLGATVFAMSTGANWVKETRNRQTALHQARDDIENIRDSGFGSLSNGTVSFSTITNHDVVFNTDYTVATSVANTNIKVLAVNVGWTSTFNVNRTNTVQLSTLVTSSLN
jgi:prepilin-type N-terminal cleavage/methylation domain-containing protein